MQTKPATVNYRTTIESTKLFNNVYYFTITHRNEVRNYCIHYCPNFLCTFYVDFWMPETWLYQTDQPTNQPKLKHKELLSQVKTNMYHSNSGFFYRQTDRETNWLKLKHKELLSQVKTNMYPSNSVFFYRQTDRKTNWLKSRHRDV